MTRIALNGVKNLSPSGILKSLLAIVIALHLWYDTSSGLCDVLLWGVTVYGLWHWRRAWAVWRCPAGIVFLLFVLFVLCSLPFSTSPSLSLRDVIKFARIAAPAWALPVLFPTRAKIRTALLYSAIAVTLILSADLIRLMLLVKADFFAEARFIEPFMLNHPNVSSMMAALAVWVWLDAGICRARRPVLASLCFGGAAVALFYLVAMTSRGPQIAFAGSVAVLPLLLPSRRLRFATGLLVLVAAALVIPNAGKLNKRFQEKASLRNLSERTTVWCHTAALVREKPVIGYGFGKKVFEDVYYGSNPPESVFHFPHPHQYWLKTLFGSGAIGLMLLATAWILLALRGFRNLQPVAGGARLPLALMLLLQAACIHIYGLGDYPDGIVAASLVWLIPCLLVATRPVNEESVT
jgi:O-antigen ligase